MVYRDFQGKKISALGLGMMRLPVVGGNDSVIDEKATAEMVEYAIKNGINYFDTAFGYHAGNSEIVAGKVLSNYQRESYFLASKFPGYDVSNMPKVKEIFEEQLVKCRTDYFDFYMFHNVCEGTIDGYLDPKYGILEYLLEQKKNGRIKHLGFSCHGDVPCFKKFLDEYGKHMEFCQLQINYMDWHFQKGEEKCRMLEELKIPLWVMEPLRGGKLCSPAKETVDVLKSMRPDETVPAWAFRFLQTLPNMGVVLSGMSNMEQLKDNIETYKDEKPLSKKEFDTLICAIDEENKKTGVPCTACHYCVSHCPQGLDIPKLLELYNENLSTKGRMTFLAPAAVGSMPDDKKPSACLGCRSCESVCPQQIEISAVLKNFCKDLGI